MDELNAYYRDWSDEKLDEHRRAILVEQERRARVAALPQQIADMRREYLDAGGDPDALLEGAP
ncbi:hypothetical protein ACI3EY_08070 [Ornithinimicrobium sp. LYQ92]|uniref:hypothetical protein n=1 Tax=Serinicoccus sp. LYQ92 TaxID=3378798 RepID=UPI0038537D7A